MSIKNYLFEIEIGNTPESYDVAIVSIAKGGGIGELNQIPLNVFGFDFEILDDLDLEKGFDIYSQDDKTIIFIVTVGERNVLNSLTGNLQSAFTTYLNKLSNKKIWLPLMGTGVGELSFEDSYLSTEKVLYEYEDYIKKYNCQITISFPKTSEAQKLYNSIAFKFDRLNKIEAENKNAIDNLEWVKDTLQIIQSKFKVSFYLVGTHWGNEDQSKRFYEEQIWENGYENGSFYDIVNEVKVGDVLIVKSTFAKDKKSILRIKAFGIVSVNPINGRELQVDWVNILEESYDIEGLGHYRNTISTINQDDLLPILMFMGSKNLEFLFYDIQLSKEVTTIAGLISDADIGEDYLDISKDTNAFARVMAAKSFEPPLAIALLGKWGSGKSFFMRKLKEDIQLLSKTNPQKGFCEAIAHIHFNAWSYMDANLWASIVTRIFEALDEYIKGTDLTKDEKNLIDEKLFLKLTLSKEELNDLKNKKESLTQRINLLEEEKTTLKKELQDRIDIIKKKTLLDIVKKVDEEFKVQEKIEDTLNKNPTFVNSVEKFEKIVPREYWENPTIFYNELKSIYTFLKAFFQRKKRLTNLLWFVVFSSLIIFILFFNNIVNLLLSWQDFTISTQYWLKITIIGGVFTRIIDTYLKLKKQIAPFWKIKEDYEAEKTNAIFELEQEEKALRLEIENYKEEIIQIDQQINNNKELIASIEFRIHNTLSTEALYTFIEKRANSEDYKKHLGIVSLIRKDFEILSGLLTGHHSELVTIAESQEFKELFRDKKPLERIILYIDDLDRCPEERVVEVLEAVNLLMAFPLFVVVVGIDPEWVTNALLKKHYLQFTGHIGKNKEKEKAIKVNKASIYLEKIFQIPFHLKSANTDNVKTMIRTLGNLQPKLIDINTINNTSKKSENKANDEKIVSNIKIDDVVKTPPVFLHKKNTLEALRFTENEILLLENMSGIIGNNPRVIKRFVNIYRVIKAHEDFTLNDYDEKEQITISFLLALAVGKYNYYLKPFEGYIDIPQYKTHTLTNLKTDLSLVYKEIENNEKLLSITFEQFNKHYQFIKRFTFNNI